MKKNIKFIKGPAGAFRLGYVAGQEAMLEAKQADELVKLGYATYMVHEDGDTSDIPDDMPERKLLVDLGLSMSDLREIEDLTELKGIGKATAAKIKKYLDDNK